MARASTNRVLGTISVVVLLMAAMFALRVWAPSGPTPTAAGLETTSSPTPTRPVPPINIAPMPIGFLPTKLPKPLPPTLKVADAKMARAGLARLPAHQQEAASFRVAAYNVLGASHTSGKGARKGYASAGARLPGAMGLLDAHGITVAGLQEFQPPQVSQFLAMRGSAWSVYPGIEARSDNAIVWRRDVWELLDDRMVGVPYFGGRPVNMPAVLLEHRSSGRRVWVGSYHNPANIGGNHAGWRQAALQVEARLAKELNTDGTPVVMTGDFNDRAEFACPFSAASGMVSADGARTVNGSCQLPRQMSVDWIFGTTEIDFSDYVADWNSERRRLSDHPAIVTAASLEGVATREECRRVKTRSGPQYYCPR